MDGQVFENTMKLKANNSLAEPKKIALAAQDSEFSRGPVSPSLFKEKNSNRRLTVTFKDSRNTMVKNSSVPAKNYSAV